MSDRGIFARPAGPHDLNPFDAALDRSVMLVVPGVLAWLPPAEALRLAEQLRGAVEEVRAAGRAEPDRD